MATQAQIDANRRNAQNSTGPRTDEGKAASRRNALTHGLSAQNILIPGEDAEEFEAFADNLRVSMEAHGDFLTDSLEVERIIHLRWKLRRVPRLEEAAVRQAMAGGNGPTDPYEILLASLLGDGCSAVLGRLQQYEMRLARELRACTKEMRKRRELHTNKELRMAYCKGFNDGAAEEASNHQRGRLTDTLEFKWPIFDQQELDRQAEAAAKELQSLADAEAAEEAVEAVEAEPSEPPASTDAPADAPAPAGDSDSAKRTQFVPNHLPDNRLESALRAALPAGPAPEPLAEHAPRPAERVA